MVLKYISCSSYKIIYCFNFGLKLALTFLCEIHRTEVISPYFSFLSSVMINVPVFIKALYNNPLPQTTPYFNTVKITLTILTISVTASHKCCNLHANRFHISQDLILTFWRGIWYVRKLMNLKGVLAFTASGLSYQHFTTWHKHGYYTQSKWSYYADKHN